MTAWLLQGHLDGLAASCCSQENRREYERKVKEIVEQSWAADEDGQ